MPSGKQDTPVQLHTDELVGLVQPSHTTSSWKFVKDLAMVNRSSDSVSTPAVRYPQLSVILPSETLHKVCTPALSSAGLP